MNKKNRAGSTEERLYGVIRRHPCEDLLHTGSPFDVVLVMDSATMKVVAHGPCEGLAESSCCIFFFFLSKNVYF